MLHVRDDAFWILHTYWLFFWLLNLFYQCNFGLHVCCCCCCFCCCFWWFALLNLQITNFSSLWFISLFISIFVTGILEMRWSGVGIDEWWRNEQFWVIGGVSAHLFALFQGLLKVCAGIDTNFTVTSKTTEDENFGELYTIKWTALLVPPTTLIVINLVGVVAGISDAINNGYQSWGPLFGKLFFAFWVIVHLYPFLKGLMGRQNRTPTIVIVWSILLASIFSLLWVRIDPFLPQVTGPNLVQCGVSCWFFFFFLCPKSWHRDFFSIEMEEENRFFICLNAFYKDGGRGAGGFGEKGPWQLNPYMFRCVKSKGCIIHTRQNRNLLKIKKRPPSLPQLGSKRRHDGNNCI